MFGRRRRYTCLGGRSHRVLEGLTRRPLPFVPHDLSTHTPGLVLLGESQLIMPSVMWCSLAESPRQSVLTEHASTAEVCGSGCPSGLAPSAGRGPRPKRQTTLPSGVSARPCRALSMPRCGRSDLRHAVLLVPRVESLARSRGLISLLVEFEEAAPRGTECGPVRVRAREHRRAPGSFTPTVHFALNSASGSVG